MYKTFRDATLKLLHLMKIVYLFIYLLTKDVKKQITDILRTILDKHCFNACILFIKKLFPTIAHTSLRIYFITNTINSMFTFSQTHLFYNRIPHSYQITKVSRLLLAIMLSRILSSCKYILFIIWWCTNFEEIWFLNILLGHNWFWMKRQNLNMSHRLK